jgi:hypothetical protein
MKILLWIAVALPCLAADPEFAIQIRSEIDRARQSLEAKPVTDPNLTGMAAGVRDGLLAATAAVEIGRFYLALERLGQAMDSLAGLRAHTAPEAPFDDVWSKASTQVAVTLRQIRGSRGPVPAAVLALRETASGRTGPLLDGARGFAVATGPKDGLFYLGEATGQAEFAKFCAGLKMPRAGSPWRTRSMLPELAALQQKANAAFVPPKSIELHPRFIALNGTIKLARELDAARSYHGAMYQYLEAVRQYGMLEQAPLDAAAQAKVREDLKSAAAETNGRRDDSIPALLVQRASAWAEHGEADEWRAARVIVSQVLPAYFAALKGAPAAPRRSGRTVEVTLVRWPYT